MARTKAATLLLLVLNLSALLAMSTGVRHEQHFGQGAGAGGFRFGIPWFGPPGGRVGGWGAGFGGGGAAGAGGGFGFARRGVEPPSTVCMEKGPCYKKRLTCPAKCFKSYSFKGTNGGGGGGGGGCSFDCTKSCQGYC